jgi:Tol biopolymer transport system component
MLVSQKARPRQISGRHNRNLRSSSGSLTYPTMCAIAVMAAFGCLAVGASERSAIIDSLKASERAEGWHVLVKARGIYYLDLAQSKLKSIYAPSDSSAPSFVGMGSLSPDGSRVTFSESADLRSYSLTIMDLQTGERTSPLVLAYLASPRWSTDGASIAFVGARARTTGAMSLLLYRFGVSAEPSAIVDGGLPTGGFSLSWSPDGDKVVYDNVEQKVCIVEVATKALTIIGPGRFPSWSPDGRYIGYQKSENEYGLYDLQTRQSTSILKGESARGALVWSPDSRYVVYSRLSGGLRSRTAGILSVTDTSGDLCVMDIQSHVKVRVYRHDGSIYPTAWGKIQTKRDLNHL